MRRHQVPNASSVRAGRITSHTWGGYRRFLTVNQEPKAERSAATGDTATEFAGAIDPDFDRGGDLYLDTHAGRYQRVALKDAA